MDSTRIVLSIAESWDQKNKMTVATCNVHNLLLICRLDTAALLVASSINVYRDLSQFYMDGRPETTKLFHFKAINFIRSVDRFVNYHYNNPCWSCNFPPFY